MKRRKYKKLCYLSMLTALLFSMPVHGAETVEETSIETEQQTATKEVEVPLIHTHEGDPFTEGGCYTGPFTEETGYAPQCNLEEALGIFKISDNGAGTRTSTILVAKIENIDPERVLDVRYEWKKDGEYLCGTSATPALTETGTYTCTVTYTEGGKRKSQSLSLELHDIGESGPGFTYEYSDEEEYCLSAPLSIKVTDKGRGLAQEPYSFDGGLTWTNENTKIIENSGEYILAVQDILGNASKLTVNITNIDSNAPTILSHNIQGSIWLSGGKEITLIAEDNGIGLHEMPYSYDGGKTWTDQNTIVVRKNENYGVIVRDKLGNASALTFPIRYIDNSAPTSKTYREENILYVIGEDKDSGLAQEPYSYDGGKTWTSENTIEVENIHDLIGIKDGVGNITYVKYQEELYQDYPTLTELMSFETTKEEIKPLSEFIKTGYLYDETETENNTEEERSYICNIVTTTTIPVELVTPKAIAQEKEEISLQVKTKAPVETKEPEPIKPAKAESRSIVFYIWIGIILILFFGIIIFLAKKYVNNL